MGSNLRRQLREALPPSIKGLPRAVALEIADDARWDDAWRYDPEKGRRSKARLSELVRWTASKNERVIRDALRNLSLAGWEFRLPMGKDRKGNLLYAVPGHALEFRVPDFEAPTVVGPDSEGTVTAGPIGTVTTVPSSEGPVTTAEGPVVTAEGPVTTVAATVTTGPPSPVSSFSPKTSPSTTSPAEDDVTVTDTVTVAEGGGGGDSHLEEINKQCQRVDAFVETLDFRGKAPGKRQRIRLGQRLMVAFKDGWTENGLRRYLDISDDPNVRNPAAVYEHRLSPDELPEASEPEPEVLPPAPLPEPCLPCLLENPAARTNVKMRFRIIDGEMQACPDCHPTRVAFLATQSRSSGDGDMWDRAMVRAQQRMSSGDWKGAGTDERIAGWAAIAGQLRAEERQQKRNGHQPYSNNSWSRPATAQERARYPHCGDPACDPETRLKQTTGHDGQPSVVMCNKCHAGMKFG
ncbi:hypothetical protein [Streptomyces gossypiisoli]|uniref:hypothetical protein n=1 Tax=Streptomyces gossypiisoli TaxID=2748864 RepID=UPI0015D9B17C|nr:hypothetical protein [Streptomyces gossypiisoli]